MPTRSNNSTARSLAGLRLSFRWTLAPSAIWSPTDMTGLSDVIGSWKTIDIAEPRRRSSCFSGMPSSSRPRWEIDPLTLASGGSRPIAASTLTDFPEPDSPAIASTSPSYTSQLTPRTACTTPSSVTKSTFRSRTDKIAVESGCQVALPVAGSLGTAPPVLIDDASDGDRRRHAGHHPRSSRREPAK